MNEQIKLDLERFAEHELERDKFYYAISESNESQNSNACYSYYLIFCLVIYLGFGFYLIFMKQFEKLREYLKIRKKIREYRKGFFQENPKLILLDDSKKYAVYKADLIEFILNDKPYEVDSEFTNLEPGSDNLENYRKKSSIENTNGTESSTSSYFCYDYFEKITTKSADSEYSKKSYDDSLADLVSVFNSCSELHDINKIADLYARFCAYLDVAKKSSYIPDSKVFLEWFLIKKLASRKHAQIRNAKKSIYSY
jgi:hypothetical protein